MADARPVARSHRQLDNTVYQTRDAGRLEDHLGLVRRVRNVIAGIMLMCYSIEPETIHSGLTEPALPVFDQSRRGCEHLLTFCR